MADYRPNEIVDIIMILGENRNNYAGAVRLYAEHYPNRRYPSNVKPSLKELKMEFLLVNADIINTTKMTRALLLF